MGNQTSARRRFRISRPGAPTHRAKVAGLVLIAAGLLALIVGRISYATHKELIAVGPYRVPLETRRVIPLRALGALTTFGGIILIVAGKSL